MIEVSDSSLPGDPSTKAQLFAQAGVTDYWVVDVPHRRVLVMRDPSDEGYRLVQTIGYGQTIRPLALPELELTAEEILGPDLG